MATVVAWYKSRVHGAWSESERGTYLVCKERGLRESRSQRIFTMSRARRSQGHASLSRDIPNRKGGTLIGEKFSAQCGGVEFSRPSYFALP